MEQTVRKGNGVEYRTTRCPIRLTEIDCTGDTGSPSIGEHNDSILAELQA